MKNRLFLLFFSFAVCLASQAQLSISEKKTLEKKQDSLKVLVRNILSDSLATGRVVSDSQFVKTLVRSLQVKNSFYFPFDSLQGVGRVYAPDSSFRILTWQLSFNDYYIRQRGAIQYNTPDGSLKLIPLRDFSEFATEPLDSVRNKDTWIGAVYYNIVEKKYNGKNYYTLFGFDDNNVRSNKKWIEVLTFDDRNQPVFGGKFFTFEKDSARRPSLYRYNIEYKKEAATTMNYDPDLDMILIDHLVSESDQPELAFTLIPDGDYEGFKWLNGRWQHVDKVFNEKLEDGQAPVPDPLRDIQGNINNQKLEQQSGKNKTKKGNNN